MIETYKLLLQSIGMFLKEQGFKKNGNNYYYINKSNIGLLNIQKSKDSTQSRIKFTLNVGVFCPSIYKFMYKKEQPKPCIDDCHWKSRIGFFLPDNDDYWWIIDSNVDIRSFSKELSCLISTYVVPAIKTHIESESLEKIWMSGISEGITEYQRYVYLTILLKLENKDILPLIIDEFEEYGKQHHCSALVKEHIKEMKLDIPYG